jgi:hypothetical protein
LWRGGLCYHVKRCIPGNDAASLGVCLLLEVSKECGSEKNHSLEQLMLEDKGTMLLQNGGSHLPGDTVIFLR